MKTKPTQPWMISPKSIPLLATQPRQYGRLFQFLHSHALTSNGLKSSPANLTPNQTKQAVNQAQDSSITDSVLAALQFAASR